MALPSVEYTPRDPAGSVLQQIVRENFETFRAEAAHLRDGEGLPRFVEEEFEAFLRCGWLAGGFAIADYAAPSTPDTDTGDRDPSPSPAAWTVARDLRQQKD